MAIKKEFDLVIEWEWLPRTKDVVICTDKISKDFDFSLLARDLAMLVWAAQVWLLDVWVQFMRMDQEEDEDHDEFEDEVLNFLILCAGGEWG